MSASVHVFTSIWFYVVSWVEHGLFSYYHYRPVLCFFFGGRRVLFCGLFGCLFVYADEYLVCLHSSVVFMWMCWVCMCVGGILLVEAGSCLQSGSQQSPDLWPLHSRTTANRLRLLFSAEKALPHLSWLHLSIFLSPQYHCPHPQMSISRPLGLVICLITVLITLFFNMTLKQCHWITTISTTFLELWL